ncbi:odorant receptor 131-2-like [Rhinophrynus dorsalis]
MVNSTALVGNMTQLSTSSNKMADNVRTFFFTLLLLCYCFYLYFMVGMTNVFFTSHHIRENARYMLFAHMLITDSLYLFLGLFLMMAAVYVVYFPVPVCVLAFIFSAATATVTPYNLAVMSLERYVAVCFPLRHGGFCTEQKANKAIALMWVVGLIPNIADFIVMTSVAQNNFFFLNVRCIPVTFLKHPVQNTIRTLNYILTFSLVALIILYTYMKVMLVARKFGSGKSTASKAGKTVMLHAIQLLLCMSSFLAMLTEQYLKEYISFLLSINFLLFMCLPRFLSPFIYGIKDEVFSKHIKKMYSINCSGDREGLQKP